MNDTGPPKPERSQGVGLTYRLIREVHNVNVSVVRSCGGVLTVRVTLIVKGDVH